MKLLYFSMNKFQTIQQGNLGNKNMREEFDRALFQATFQNLLSQVFQKQLNANKIQMDLIRKIQGKSQSISFHLQIIKQCRKSIDYVDMILKDVRQYFFDLKIDQLYNLFDSVFRILVYIVKKVCQCYLKRVCIQRKNQTELIQKNYLKSINQQQVRQYQNLQKKEVNKRKKDIRQLQILDFQIAGIQSKEQEISNKMNLLISDLQSQRKKINNIDPIAHYQIYNQIQKIFNEISQKTESLFNNFFKGTFQEQNNFVRPEQIQGEVLFPLKNDLKTLTKAKIDKVIQILLISFQSKLDKSIQQMKSLHSKRKTKKKKTENISIKDNQLKQYVSSPNSHKSFKKYLNESESSFQKQICTRDYAKQVEIFRKQNEQLKKTIRSLNYQIQNQKLFIKKQQSDKVKLCQENLQLQKLFKRRTLQLQQTKSSLIQTIQKNLLQTSMCIYKKQVLSEHPNKKINDKKTKIQQFQDKETQTEGNHQVYQDISGKQPILLEYKSFLSVRSKIRKGSIDGQEKKNKKKASQMQSNFKTIMSKLTSLLIEKQTTKNSQETLQISKLIQQGKYDQMIDLVKENLNQGSQSKNSNAALQGKQKNTRQKKKREGKFVKTQSSKINSCLMVNIGVQTVQKTIVPKKVFKNSLRDNIKVLSKTQSMDSHELQKRMSEQKAKNNQFLSSGQTPLNWLRSSRQTKQNEDNNFLMKNIHQQFYRNSMIEQKHIERNKGKNNGRHNTYLENTLFEQINLDTGQSNKSRNKRDSLMLKMYGIKQKQKKQKQIQNRNSGVIVQEYQQGINQNKILNQQPGDRWSNEPEKLKQLSIKKEDFIVEKSEIEQQLLINERLSSQKLIQILKRASNQNSVQKISQIIQKFKESLTKCSTSIYDKNKEYD